MGHLLIVCPGLINELVENPISILVQDWILVFFWVLLCHSSIIPFSTSCAICYARLVFVWAHAGCVSVKSRVPIPPHPLVVTIDFILVFKI